MKRLFTTALVVFVLGSCQKDKTVLNTETPASNGVVVEGATAYKADTQNSVIYWTGTKPGGKHTGTLQLKEGVLGWKDSKLVSGKFVMDMNSLTVTDLKPGNGKEDLEVHLKGIGDVKGANDFFNVAKYPEGSFTINSISEGEGKTIIYGNLALKGIVKAVNFPAKVTQNGSTIAIESDTLLINRTHWGINYGSKTIFNNLKDKFIDDNVMIQVSLKATKQP